MNRSLWLLFILLIFTSFAKAETFTLSQAISRALVTDPRISEMQAFVRHAQALLAEAEGSNGVSVSANTFVGVSSAVEGGLFGEESCGVNKECVSRDDRFDLGNGISPWFYLQFGVFKPLSTFGKIENYTRAAQQNIKLKEQDVRLQRGSTTMDVKRAYYGHLTAKTTRLFLAGVKKRVDRAKENIQSLLDEGDGGATLTDLYALQSASSLAQSYIIRAHVLEKIAVDGLKVLTGIKLTDELNLVGEGVEPLELPDMDLLELQKRAMSSRPEMSQLKHGLLARRAMVKAKQAMKKPNIYAGLVGMFSYSPLRDRVDNPYIADPFNDIGVTPVIGMKWEWAGATQSAQVQQAKAELEALLEKNSFAQLGIPYQVSENYQQIHALHAAVGELRNGSKAARRWMISSYSDFQAGVGGVDMLVTAFTAFVTAHSDYLKLVYDYNMQVVLLEQVTGAYQ